MPPNKTKKPSANLHDKRHETGLAAPGKPVRRRRSDGSLSERLDDNTPTSGFGTTAQACESKSSSTPDNEFEDGLLGGQERHEQKSALGINEAVVSGHSMDMATETSLPDPHTRSLNRVRSRSNSELLQGKDESARGLACSDSDLTIIPRHPLLDILAILALFLLCPQWLLAIVEFFYAWLTFLPHSSAWASPSLTSSPALWFQGHAGNPSFLTTIMVDLGVLLLWIILPFGKDLALDIPQAIIALSVGGGSGGRGAGLHGTTCLSIITLCHLLRSKAYRQRLLNFTWSTLSKASFGGYKLGGFVPVVAGPSYSPHNWPRTFLEIHIVTQCIIKIIRNAISRGAEPRPNLSKKIDPEAAVSSITPSTPSNDPAGEGAKNASTDGRPPGPPPSSRGTKDKSFGSGKRRRRQALFVRHEQPLWAALAENKISFSKKEEHLSASKDAAEAEAHGVQELGNALRQHGAERIWVTGVGPTEIEFIAFIPTSAQEAGETIAVQTQGGGHDDNFNRGTTLPLAIRVNGASWTSTTLHNEVDITGGETRDCKTVRGIISGLTASTTYLVEFVRLADEKRVYHASLVTSPIASNVQGPGPVVATQPQQSLRPSSPTTTLKTSIVTAENELHEYRSRLKKSRKEHKTLTGAVKKEVENYNQRMVSRDTDERQRQKQTSLRLQITALEESSAAISAEIDKLGDIPEADHLEIHRNIELCKEERRYLGDAANELRDAGVDAKKAVETFKAENATLRGKREKLQNRLKKFEEGLAKLHADRDKQLRDQTIRDMQRQQGLHNWQRLYENTMKQVENLETSRQDLEAKLAQFEAQLINYYDSGYSQPPPGYQPSPHSSEATYDGYPSGIHYPSSLQQYSSKGYSRVTPPLVHRGDSIKAKAKGRTSSMHSQISGFTDDDTPRFEANGHTVQISEATALHGSDPDSHGTLVSPIPKLSPIGSEMGHGSPKRSKGQPSIM